MEIHKDPRGANPVVLDDCFIDLDQFMAVVRFGAELTYSPAFCERVQKNRRLVERFLEENRPVYGVTTGFGENVRYVIPKEDARALQRNIVRSHACAVGEPLSREQARAVRGQNSGR